MSEELIPAEPGDDALILATHRGLGEQDMGKQVRVSHQCICEPRCWAVSPAQHLHLAIKFWRLGHAACRSFEPGEKCCLPKSILFKKRETPDSTDQMDRAPESDKVSEKTLRERIKELLREST